MGDPASDGRHLRDASRLCQATCRPHPPLFPATRPITPRRHVPHASTPARPPKPTPCATARSPRAIPSPSRRRTRTRPVRPTRLSAEDPTTRHAAPDAAAGEPRRHLGVGPVLAIGGAEAT
jgi:hypothetical protein